MSKILYVTIILSLSFTPLSGVAFWYTNESIVHSTHISPVDFILSSTGEITGSTTDGAVFSQVNIINNITRLQRFEIHDAWWYVSDRGVIGYGESLSDLQALSIYMTMM